MYSKPKSGVRSLPQTKYPLKLTSTPAKAIKASILDQRLKQALEKLRLCTAAVEEIIAKSSATRTNASIESVPISKYID
jgi:hypothetical protein